MKRFTTEYWEMNEINTTNSFTPSQERLIIILGALMCAGLFIQHTVTLGNWHTKTTLSDLILPFVFISIAIKTKVENRQVSKWGIKVLAILLFICIWLIIACFNGYIQTQTIISWAWGTKLIGFFILLAYMITGAALCVDELAKKLLLRTYMCATYFVAIASYLRFLWEMNSGFNVDSVAFRPIGFSENPNALAFILGSSLIMQIAISKEFAIKSRFVNSTGLAFTIATIILTGSRSTYLGLLFSIPLLFIYKNCIKWKTIVAGGLITSVLIFNCSLDYSPIMKNLNNSTNTVRLGEESKIDLQEIKLDYAKKNPIVIDSGVIHRLEMTRIGLDLLSKNPIVGSGVGSFLVEYGKKTGSSSVLHTSIVWIAVETGIIGLLAFAALIGLIMKKAWTKSRWTQGWEYRIVCLIITYSFGASFGMEILYQRQIWFVLGMMICNDLIKSSRCSTNRINIASSSSANT